MKLLVFFPKFFLSVFEARKPIIGMWIVDWIGSKTEHLAPKSNKSEQNLGNLKDFREYLLLFCEHEMEFRLFQYFRRAWELNSFVSERFVSISVPESTHKNKLNGRIKANPTVRGLRCLTLPARSYSK